MQERTFTFFGLATGEVLMVVCPLQFSLPNKGTFQTFLEEDLTDGFYDIYAINLSAGSHSGSFVFHFVELGGWPLLKTNIVDGHQYWNSDHREFQSLLSW